MHENGVTEEDLDKASHPLSPIANAYREWLTQRGEPFGQDSYDSFRREVWKDEHAPLMVQSLPIRHDLTDK